jgi:hypothetical protein
MVTSTDDNVLRQDMPSALQKVESAAKLLEEAAKMSQVFLFNNHRAICERTISEILAIGSYWSIKIIFTPSGS